MSTATDSSWIGRRFLGAQGGGSLGRGMQASGDWANLPGASGPIAAVPCPRLHALCSRRDWTPICRLPATGLSRGTVGVQYSA
jgi:hypothetical protein